MDNTSLKERRASADSSSKNACNVLDHESNPVRDSEKKYAKGMDGKLVFTVPETPDMVSQLLSPTKRKNVGDIIVIAVLGLHIFMFQALPTSARIPVFATIYFFWRASYNGGIGYLLRLQSQDCRLVTWTKKWKIFDSPAAGNNAQLYHFLKREMETTVSGDYTFEYAPAEFNTWLLFRRVVDLILMCDFTSYCLFAVACGYPPSPSENPASVSLRWLVGWLLIGINLWVKVDAHRVVRDYNWYWGDFFYLIEQEMVFDGVYKILKNPMYTVGYIGYYGISLLSASYKVLLVSIIAHTAQLAFLAWVEDPHFEKTYNDQPAKKEI